MSAHKGFKGSSFEEKGSDIVLAIVREKRIRQSLKKEQRELESLKKKMEIQQKKEDFGESWKYQLSEYQKKSIQDIIGDIDNLKIRDSIDINQFFDPVKFYTTDDDVKMYFDYQLYQQTEDAYKDALEEIKKLKNQGYTLILVTASFEIYAKYIAENLGFDRCMGTELWTFRGKYTGYMYGKNCYGAAKRYRLFTEQLFPNYSYKNIAYSDSISDLPLFNFADTKICVNPDKRLKEHALKNKDKGFIIAEWR